MEGSPLDEGGVELDDAANSASRQALAAMVQKNRAFVSHHGALGQVALQRAGGLAGQRHLAFFAPLAAHAQPSLGAIHIFQIQPGQLAHADAAAVEQLENGAVARRERALQLARRDAVNQRVDLLGRHHFRQLLGGLGGAHQAPDVDPDDALAQQKTEEPAHRGQLAADGHGREFHAIQRRQPLAEHEEIDGRRLGRRHFGRRQELQKLAEIGGVGGDGVGRSAAARQLLAGTVRSGVPAQTWQRRYSSNASSARRQTSA